MQIFNGCKMKKMQCKIPTTEEIICPFLLYIFINYLIYLVLKNADLLKKKGGGGLSACWHDAIGQRTNL